MDYSAKYALHAAGASPAIIDSALHVRGVVNAYYRGRATKDEAARAIGGISGAPWFSQVFLPTGTGLPDKPAQTQWRAQMDYDPLAVVARVKVPMAFFFAGDDAYVPLPESMAHVSDVVTVTDVMIQRVPDTDHFMETGASGAGLTSADYVQSLLDWLRRHELGRRGAK